MTKKPNITLNPDDLDAIVDLVVERLARTRPDIHRQAISAGARERIAQRKLDGTYKGGRIANPPQIPADHVTRILELRDAGLSMRKIAQTLNDQGLTPPQADKYAHTTISRVIQRAQENQCRPPHTTTPNSRPKP